MSPLLQNAQPSTQNDAQQNPLLIAAEAAAQLDRLTASNGLHYATLLSATPAGTAGAAGHTSPESLARLAGTVPANLAAILAPITYAFVPLALSSARLAGQDVADAAVQSSDSTLIAPVATPALQEQAICHRNATVAGADFVFLSAQLHNDSFALAFEFFINIAHDLVDVAGMAPSFGEVLAQQVSAGVRGETSMDAWEHRATAYGLPAGTESGTRANPFKQAAAEADRERAAKDYQQSAFADAVAIYLLSLFLDFDYIDLREREYPLLAPSALAARLRAVNALYPPNAGYAFSIQYRRRG